MDAFLLLQLLCSIRYFFRVQKKAEFIAGAADNFMPAVAESCYKCIIDINKPVVIIAADGHRGGVVFKKLCEFLQCLLLLTEVL